MRLSNGKEYELRECSMAEIAKHFHGREVVESVYAVYPEWSGVLLNDGTVVVAQSRWTGPYSSVTPDIDGDEPAYAIGREVFPL